MAERGARVFVERVDGYASAARAAWLLMERAGILDALPRVPATVVVKPNLIQAAPPHRAVTTHPEVVTGVVQALQHAGHRVIVADSYSGAYPWSVRGLRRVYGTTGMADVAVRTGCTLSVDLDWVTRPLTGRTLARAEVLRVVHEADFVLNVPKLKTHAYTGMTCAVKNLFGVVPGHFKIGYHARFAHEGTFSLALKDLALSLPVAGTVVDAVEAMEGEGPAAGTPRFVGVVVASTDLQAVDRLAARFCHLPRSALPWLDPGEDSVEGPTPEELLPQGLTPATPHRLDMGVFRSGLVRAVTRRVLRDVFSPAPRVDKNTCSRCGACRAACPAGAITFQDLFPRIDPGACIRCYCCHEACPERALTIPSSWLAKVLA